MCLGSPLSYLGPGEALGIENIVSTPDHTPYTPTFTTHASEMPSDPHLKGQTRILASQPLMKI